MRDRNTAHTARVGGSQRAADSFRVRRIASRCCAVAAIASALTLAAATFASATDVTEPSPLGKSVSVSRSTAQERPRIGLVLGGGGARGLAHVGVLKVLDQLRIPVDYVAGTSMGAIVGGLFAMGRTPGEIESAIGKIDWGDLFSDHPDRGARSFRRKEDDRSNFLDFEFGIEKGKLKLPRSLIAGQKLAFAFDDPALHTAGLTGFDSLAIPFRAVATDLRSGEMVVLKRGSLVRALRASMAVPAFFAPVETGHRLLIDGGVVRNLPIDVARDMGADIVLAIDVSEDVMARDPETLSSLMGLSLQLTGLVIKFNTDQVLPLADFVLRPDLGNLSVLDFEHFGAAFRAGEAAARLAAATLQRYALSPEDYAQHVVRRGRVEYVPVRVDSVQLINRSRIDRRAVLHRLSAQPGRILDFDRLRRDLANIYDLGSLELVDFDLQDITPVERAPGTAPTASRPAGMARAGNAVPHDLRLQLNEKTYAPNLMRVGLSLTSEARGQTRFQSNFRLTRVEMNHLGAEWRTDVQLGARNGTRTEWYQPLQFSRQWFASVDAGYTNRFQDVYDGEERITEYGMQEALGHFDIGSQLGRFGEVRSGLFYGWVKTTLPVGFGVPVDEGTQGGWQVRFAVDRLDGGDFPTRGQVGSLQLRFSRRALGSETRHDRLEVSGTHFQTWSQNTFWLGGQAGTSLGSALPPHEEFLLGGVGSLSGLRQEERRGNVLALGRLGYNRSIVRDVDLFGTDLYAATWVEAGAVWPNNESIHATDLLYTGAVAFGADSIVGPVFLIYGRTHKGDDNVLFTVGKPIAID